MRLEGKTAVITGAASGLGLAIAKRFLQEGATVIATDIDTVAGQTLWSGHSDKTFFYTHDVANESDWLGLRDFVEQQFSTLDILVNNAGVTLMGSIEDIPIDAWEKTMAVDLKGPFLGCRTMLPLMKVHGGSIINIASVSSFKPRPELVAYNAAKAGVIMMTKSVALHCGQSGYNIRANCINPGVILTDILQKVMDQVDDGETLMDSYKAMHPIGRIGMPEEIAATATYLASDEAAFVTGTSFNIDGGLGICE